MKKLIAFVFSMFLLPLLLPNLQKMILQENGKPKMA